MAYAVSDIIAEMSSHGFEDIDTTQLLRFINDAYWEFCSLPYPFLERTAQITLTAGTATIPIVDSGGHTVNKIISIGNNTQRYALKPIRLDTLSKKFAGYLTDTGTPIYYYEINDVFFAYPVPSASDVLTVRYTITPTELGVGDTPIVPIQFRRIITNGALYKAYMMNDDVDIAQYFKREVQEHAAKVQEDLWRQQLDMPDYVEDTSVDNDGVWDTFY